MHKTTCHADNKEDKKRTCKEYIRGLRQRGQGGIPCSEGGKRKVEKACSQQKLTDGVKLSCKTHKLHRRTTTSVKSAIESTTASGCSNTLLYLHLVVQANGDSSSAWFTLV